MKRNKVFYLCFFLGVVAFYVLNVLTPECTDDYSYRFIFWNGSADSTAPIITWKDFFVSQSEHYFYHSGRVVCAALFQLFSAFIGKGLFAVFNAIVWGVFIFSIFDYTKLKRTVHNLLYLIVGLCLLLPIFKETFLWMVGSLAYLWPATMLLGFLILQESILKKDVSYKWLILFPVGLLCGLTHEGLSFPLCVSFFLCSIPKIKSFWQRADFFLVIGLFIGTALCVLTPSTFSRAVAEDGSSLVARLTNGVYWLFRLKAFYVLLAVIIYRYYTNKKECITLIKDNAILLISVLSTFGILFFSGYDSERTSFGTEFYSLLFLFRILPDIHVPRYVTLIMTSFVICGYSLACYFSYLNYKEDRAEIEQIKAGNCLVGTSKVDLPWGVDLFVLDNGNYCRYNSKNEFNRCQAKTFGLDSLCFMPLSVLADIQNDRITDSFEIPTSKPFYIKRMEVGEIINHSYFLVNKSRLSGMPIFNHMQRFSATEVEAPFDFYYSNGKKYIIIKRNDLVDDRVHSIRLE